ncbi:hypothetical protein BJ165DRAFT_444290 [Panaeolus papilionaceus]|nr:hypothetical protein BJ165DRAFT_444290 [Panaeolus papilionaceus]
MGNGFECDDHEKTYDEKKKKLVGLNVEEKKSMTGSEGCVKGWRGARFQTLVGILLSGTCQSANKKSGYPAKKEKQHQGTTRKATRNVNPFHRRNAKMKTDRRRAINLNAWDYRKFESQKRQKVMQANKQVNADRFVAFGMRGI